MEVRDRCGGESVGVEVRDRCGGVGVGVRELRRGCYIIRSVC